MTNRGLIPCLGRSRLIDLLVLAALVLCASILRAAQTTPADAIAPEQFTVGSGMTHLLDLPVNIERVSVAAPETAEAVPVSARSLMINGKVPGETSVVIWLSDGSRREYDVAVKIGASRLEAAKEQLEREFGNDVQLTVDNGAAYISGRLRDMYQAQRAAAIAATVGKVVNLLKVDIPPQERQILLKVRFADVDRSKSLDLGVSFVGAPKGYPLSSTVGTYAGGTITGVDSPGNSTTFTLSDALNLFLFDPHLDLGATIEALANKNILQILAEPNLLAMNGKEASFVAGGEFPFPTLQGGGAGVGQVTVSFREFGIRLHFVPTITPRGTIKLHVSPEVSSLDYANALSTAGGTVPALNTRRVETEIELQNGQSFAIARAAEQPNYRSPEQDSWSRRYSHPGQVVYNQIDQQTKFGTARDRYARTGGADTGRSESARFADAAVLYRRAGSFDSGSAHSGNRQDRTSDGAAGSHRNLRPGDGADTTSGTTDPGSRRRRSFEYSSVGGRTGSQHTRCSSGAARLVLRTEVADEHDAADSRVRHREPDGLGAGARLRPESSRADRRGTDRACRR